MKSLTIIIHTDDEQELTNQLRSMNQVKGFTLSHIEGHGIEPDKDAFLLARDKVVGSSPRLRADVLLQDEDLADVLQTLGHIKKRGEINGAYYWVTAIEQQGHL